MFTVPTKYCWLLSESMVCPSGGVAAITFEKSLAIVLYTLSVAAYLFVLQLAKNIPHANIAAHFDIDFFTFKF